MDHNLHSVHVYLFVCWTVTHSTSFSLRPLQAHLTPPLQAHPHPSPPKLTPPKLTPPLPSSPQPTPLFVTSYPALTFPPNATFFIGLQAAFPRSSFLTPPSHPTKPSPQSLPSLPR
ncbi:hypothetical protein Pmani_017868 [Petrolisthes manimaculis]|uniref:Uncharacterized protein n=1 Tax=Petrolisthes manimaculis TaxID=1843537 RepID=A0AAE1U7A7_9EUCA|nr:hypothetical protein Pmani_017868 [Petrolisthes manimaculis]